jgi:hypothetical protein
MSLTSSTRRHRHAKGRELSAVGRARRNNRFCFPHASPETQTAELLALAAMKVFKIQPI